MLRTVKAYAKWLWFPARINLVLSCVSAFSLVFSFPPYNCEFLAWVAFVALFFAIENTNKVQAFVLAYICGVVFWLGTIYWLAHVTVVGMLVLVLYLALYWGVFGFIIRWLDVFRSSISIFLVPAVWVLLEYCRSYALTGFPWSLLAYSQTQTLAAIQVADITGAWGVSYMVMMANVSGYAIFKYISHGAAIKRTPVIVSCCILLCVYLYGVARLHPPARSIDSSDTRIKVSVVQGNIPQELKWDSYAQDFIMQRYRSLSRIAAKDNPDLIVWPEAAVAAIVEPGGAYLGSLQEFISSLHANLLTGAVTSRNEMYYNSAILLRPDLSVEMYDKIHLVPFGEYIPLRAMFGFLETVVPIGEVQRGSGYRVFKPGIPGQVGLPAFATLICFEDAFPELSRRFVNAGAQFLVTVTNDAWYKKTSAPYQHFQSSVLRAVENRVWMVRSANTGVSGFIRPDGSVEGVVSDAQNKTIFVSGYLTREIKVSTRSGTVYTKFGDWVIVAMLLLIVLCLLCRNTKRWRL